MKNGLFADTVMPRVADVGLAEAAVIVRRWQREHVRVARAARVQVERADQARDVGQFHRAFDLRVRGEDLLEQRRSGPRQPDDEDGRRIVAAPALALLEELARAEFDLLADRPLERLRTVVALRLLERIAPRVELERLVVLAAILERLAEREAEVIAVRRAECAGVDLLAHGRDLRVREAIGLEVGEAPVRVAEIRALPRGLAVVAFGLRRGCPGS